MCDLINEDDILAIRTTDKNFPYYNLHHEINNVCCTVAEISCRQMGGGRSLVLVIKYYEQEGNDFLHQ